MANYTIPENIINQELKRWVTDMAELCEPDAVCLCDGSKEEYDRLCQDMVDAGTFIKLNQIMARAVQLLAVGLGRCVLLSCARALSTTQPTRLQLNS